MELTPINVALLESDRQERGAVQMIHPEFLSQSIILDEDLARSLRGAVSSAVREVQDEMSRGFIAA